MSVDLSAAERLDLALHLDPVLLFRRLGIEPTPWQVGFLRSRAPRRLLLAHRQSGKSTSTAVLAAHVGIFEPGALVLLVAQSLRAAQELLTKVSRTVRASEAPLRIAAESKVSLSLGNGSRIVCIPGSEDSARGFSAPRLVVVDEAARVPAGVYQAIRPLFTNSPDGWLVAMTTATDTTSWFHEEWTAGGAEWQRFTISPKESPWVTDAMLSTEREKLGDSVFQREYENVFGESESDRRNPRLFGAEMIGKLFG